jgi:hypothetical protein
MNAIPKDPCDIHTGATLPTVDVVTPTEGQTLGSPITVKISVATPAGFESAVINVGGKDYTAAASGSYYEVVVTLPAGSYTLTATVKDKILQTAKETINFTIS